MQRINIIGNCGSGKSTLARQLGDVTGIDVIHLDVLSWLPGWVERSEEAFKESLKAVVARDSWIIEGNYSRTWPIRMPPADTVIWLDVPVYRCVYRILKRRIMYAGKSRPDMAEGCREKIDLEFIRWTMSYPKRQGDVRQRVAQHNKDAAFIRIGNQKELLDLLENAKKKPLTP